MIALDIVSGLFAATGVASILTTDTHLAAIAIEHQAELHSNDADFTRVTGLRQCNPPALARVRDRYSMIVDEPGIRTAPSSTYGSFRRGAVRGSRVTTTS